MTDKQSTLRAKCFKALDLASGHIVMKDAIAYVRWLENELKSSKTKEYTREIVIL